MAVAAVEVLAVATQEQANPVQEEQVAFTGEAAVLAAIVLPCSGPVEMERLASLSSPILATTGVE